MHRLTNFCNIAIYPPFVMHLPDAGHKNGPTCRRNAVFIRHSDTFMCICLFCYLTYLYGVLHKQSWISRVAEDNNNMAYNSVQQLRI